MSKRIALIVATYEYQDTGLRQLVTPAQDAEALARVLKDPEIGGFDVRTLINQPSYEVNREIETFFIDRKLRRDDLLLFYFSGHGIKDEEGRLYFATPDTHRDQLRSTAVTATLIHDVMRYSHSRRQVLILDCCYSGAFPKGMLARADETIGTKERFEGRGRVVLTASDSMQYAFEGDAVEGQGVRSIFTSVLLKGLETGEADLDRDGNITLDELYDYVYYRIADQTPQQRPGKWTFDVQGDIIVARNSHAVIKPAHVPPSRVGVEQTESTAARERRTRPPWAVDVPIPWSWIAGVGLAALALFVVAFLLTGSFGKDRGTALSPTERTATAVAAIHTPTDTPQLTATPEAVVPAADPPTETLTLGVGSTMVREADGMVMVYVPGGKFKMGSTEGDDDEQPVHSAILNSFWIDKTKVTNAQFAAFMNYRGNQTEGGVTWLDLEDEDCLIEQVSGEYRPKSDYDSHPVIKVTWYGAAAYCEWAGARLPTEAEWEYAARGPRGDKYPWGDDDPTCELAQFDACSGQTVPVGSLPDGASWCEALDMAGNVWEWVNDWYSPRYRIVLPDSNPTGPESGESKVLRGGSWSSSFFLVRSSNRSKHAPVDTFGDSGFRCAAASTP